MKMVSKSKQYNHNQQIIFYRTAIVTNSGQQQLSVWYSKSKKSGGSN
jgi:hypothetical protein